MSLKHMTKRSRTFRQTLLGIVKDLHQKFLMKIGLDVSKMKNIKRWHPSFKLEECDPIRKGWFKLYPYFTACPITANI